MFFNEIFVTCDGVKFIFITRLAFFDVITYL
jgi:hypothetical protein